MATLLALRSAAHPGYDRVVLEFGPGGLPGYRAEYVDRPQYACGSGEEVRLEGDAWIQLDLEPARAHDDEGGATLAQRSLRPALANVLELRLICDFEAHVSWVVAVRRPTAFRMLRLGQPDRLVLDVRR